MSFAIICLLAGLGLGQYFRATVLVPATALALTATAAAEVSQGYGMWPVILSAAVAAACLQTGYLLGIGIHHVLIVVRVGSRRANSLGGSAPTGRPAH